MLAPTRKSDDGKLFFFPAREFIMVDVAAATGENGMRVGRLVRDAIAPAIAISCVRIYFWVMAFHRMARLPMEQQRSSQWNPPGMQIC